MPPSPSPAPGVVDHVTAAPTMMSLSVFVVLLVAMFVDGFSFGPEHVRDRIAFAMGVSAIRAGWDGSALDRWTVGQLSDWITEIAKTGNHGFIGAVQSNAPNIIGSLVGLVMLYAIGVMAPAKWSKRLGPFARLTFGKGGGKGLNWRLWAPVLVLGLMGDMTGGVVGGIVNGLLTHILMPLVGRIPDWLFGLVS